MKKRLLLLLIIAFLFAIPNALAKAPIKKCKYSYFSEYYGVTTAEVSFYSDGDFGDSLYIDLYNSKKYEVKNENISDYKETWEDFKNENGNHYLVCPYYLYYDEDGENEGFIYYDKNKLMSNSEFDEGNDWESHILVSDTIKEDWDAHEDTPYDKYAQGDDYSQQGYVQPDSSKTTLLSCSYNYFDNYGWNSGIIHIYDDYSYNAYMIIQGGEGPYSSKGYLNDFTGRLVNWEETKAIVKEKGQCPYFFGMDTNRVNQGYASFDRTKIELHDDFDFGDEDVAIGVSKTIAEDMGSDYDIIEHGSYRTETEAMDRAWKTIKMADNWNPEDPYQFHIADLFCSEPRVIRILKAVGNLLIIVKMALPLMIVIAGTFDFAKAVMEGKSDSLSKKAKKLGIRVLIGLFVFFIPTFTHVMFNNLAYYKIISKDVNQCQGCLLNPNDPQFCNEWANPIDYTPTVKITAASLVTKSSTSGSGGGTAASNRHEIVVTINPQVRIIFEVDPSCNSTYDDCLKTASKVISVELINSDAREIYSDLDLTNKTVYDSIVILCDVAKENDKEVKEVTLESDYTATNNNKIKEYIESHSEQKVAPVIKVETVETQTPSQPMSATEQEVRSKLSKFAIAASQEFKKGDNFMYLSPDDRDTTGCLEKFYNKQKCTTSNKTSCTGNSCLYGTDCNGFVSYVLHQGMGLDASGSEYKFFNPDYDSGWWNLNSSSKGYFTRDTTRVRVITGDNKESQLAKIKTIAKEGDILGRLCYKTPGDASKGFTASHIGVYTGNGKVVDNHNPIEYRDLANFVRITYSDGRKYDDCEITIFHLNTNKFVKTSTTEATPATPVTDLKSTGFNKNVASYFNEDKYKKKRITIPNTEKCKQLGNCNEKLVEEGYTRVADGVFYFPYHSDLNGNPNGKGTGTEGIHGVFDARLQKFFAAAKKAGYDISMITGVGDGYRDIATQQYYKCCQTGGSEFNGAIRTSDSRLCPSGCTSFSLASTPGTSPHGWGIAADLYLKKGGVKHKDAIRWAHAHAEEYGLAFPVSSEDWHIEPLYVCDINGQSGKYGSCKRQTNYICKEDKKGDLADNPVGGNSSGTYCNP